MIRPAAPTDAEPIAAIWNPLIRESSVTFNSVEKTVPGIMALLEEKAAAEQPFLVVERDGKVQGFGTYGTFRGGPGYARIVEHTILLAPSGQGGGLGRQLMTALETEARRRAIGSLIAGISGENTAGIAFHRAIGFVEVGRVPQAGWKFGRWMDLVLMQKRLD